MAIAHIGVNDVNSINKINQAIDEANLVDGKAEKTALDAEILARQLADGQLQGQIATKASRAALATVDASVRPGDAISFFSASIDGEPAVVPPLAESVAVASPSGKVAKIDGAGNVAPINVWRIEPGHVYRVRFVVQRAVDTEDPSNDAVRLGVRWLTADKTGAGTTELANLLDITVSDGRLEYMFTLATADASDIDAVSPAGAVYFRPFVRTFGSGVTHVEVIQVVDATDAMVWSPDVELLHREVAGLNARLNDALDRIQTLENET
ncbi:hypothetical protein IB238_05680 [Rhizobium sp. ARZ01]|uniref:hypothetical protein n=1 Tax=Rhizobium sp. ARZ01 TaxID=2769313 RepID=UPI00177C4C63|nr:hypothetical protein [Rhizobium sp. ARZ01]MBD9372120.1 hypothetical protein [Rhizobium sp. ARZ01]